MNKEYSDSIFPMGLGASFISTLVVMLSASAILGLFLSDKIDFPQLGGVFLLIIFLVLLVGPIFYNRKESRFERERFVLKRHDGIGILQGLRGALFRLLVYEKGIEIRAFYHRYYIPFDRINSASIEEGYFNCRLNIVTGIDGIPDYIVSTGKQFLSLAFLIAEKAKSKKI